MSMPARIGDGQTARRPDGESLVDGWEDIEGPPSPSPTFRCLPSVRIPSPDSTGEGALSALTVLPSCRLAVLQSLIYASFGNRDNGKISAAGERIAARMPPSTAMSCPVT